MTQIEGWLKKFKWRWWNGQDGNGDCNEFEGNDGYNGHDFLEWEVIVVAMISFRRLEMVVIKNGQDLLKDVGADGWRQLTVNSNLVTFRHRKSASSNAEKEVKIDFF